MKQCHMILESEKKHSVRYNAASQADEEVLVSAYIMKTALTRPYPLKIKVTIEEE
jgi:hypothetical protein